MQGAVAQAPIKRPGLFSQKALQLWSFALTLTVQNETDKDFPKLLVRKQISKINYYKARLRDLENNIWQH